MQSELKRWEIELENGNEICFENSSDTKFGQTNREICYCVPDLDPCPGSRSNTHNRAMFLNNSQNKN